MSVIICNSQKRLQNLWHVVDLSRPHDDWYCGEIYSNWNTVITSHEVANELGVDLQLVTQETIVLKQRGLYLISMSPRTGQYTVKKIGV
jgi:hypothetical protein